MVGRATHDVRRAWTETSLDGFDYGTPHGEAWAYAANTKYRLLLLVRSTAPHVRGRSRAGSQCSTRPNRRPLKGVSVVSTGGCTTTSASGVGVTVRSSDSGRCSSHTNKIQNANNKRLPCHVHLDIHIYVFVFYRQPDTCIHTLPAVVAEVQQLRVALSLSNFAHAIAGAHHPIHCPRLIGHHDITPTPPVLHLPPHHAAGTSTAPRRGLRHKPGS